MTFELHEAEQLGGLPVYGFCLESLSETIALGISPDTECPVGYEDRVIWLTDGSSIVAALTYTYLKHSRKIWINHVYVRPICRRSGAYRMMYERLRERAKELTALRIDGGISDSNENMQKTAAAMGRKRLYSIWSESL